VSHNDLAFVRETVRLLEDVGIRVLIFGGWAEELLGLASPRQHHDLDLLYPANDFSLVDALFAAKSGLTEIRAKRLPHKRAFLRRGIMTELILVCSSPTGVYFTDFTNKNRYQWPCDLVGREVDEIRVASAESVLGYRADYRRIHGTRR
jgi:hypothetical protein